MVHLRHSGAMADKPEERRKQSAENQETAMSDSAARSLEKLREMFRMRDQMNRNIREFVRWCALRRNR
jgi:hypothetical protein